MPSALLIAGYERWHLEEVRGFARFLREHTRIRHTRVFDALGRSGDEILHEVRRYLRRGHEDDLFVLFILTHGSRDGFWEFNKRVPLFCLEMAETIMMSGRRTLVVNGACHSGVMAQALQEVGADPERVGLIAACTAETLAYGTDLTNALVHNWKACHVFRPRLMRTAICGGPWMSAPIGLIRISNPLLRAWDHMRYWVANAIYALELWVRPFREVEIHSLRWGAELDPLLWKKSPRRR